MANKKRNNNEQLIGALKACGGYYKCPKDELGKRLGPLAGYAGKYIEPITGEMKQYVGEIYYNFAKLEERPMVLDHLTSLFAANLPKAIIPDIFIGAPMGGITFAYALGKTLNCRFIFAEKKVISLGTAEKREESEIILNRHRIRDGEEIIIVEDVCNNFSTTQKMINLIEINGGKVKAIACLLNRSLLTRFSVNKSVSIPILSLAHIPTIQFTQRNPSVVDDVASGNVIWKPKDDWSILEELMVKHGYGK